MMMLGRALDLVRAAGLALAVLALGCSRETPAPTEKVGVVAQQLTAADWPSYRLVATNSIMLESNVTVTGDVAVKNSTSGTTLYGSGVELSLNGLNGPTVVNGNAWAATYHSGTQGTLNGNLNYNGFV